MIKKVQPLYPLAQYLPFQFRNGTVIRQFAKPCLRCHHLLPAQNMVGIIRAIDAYTALAAHATCPSCGLQFYIACMINDKKVVQSIWLPARFFRWYLQVLPFTSRMPQPIIHPINTLPTSTIPNPVSAHQPPVQSINPSPVIERATVFIGQYNGKPIPAYIIIDNEKIPFSHIASPGIVIQAAEYLIDQHLVYKKNV